MAAKLLLGIEIDTDVVKLVEMCQKAGAYEVRSWAKVNILNNNPVSALKEVLDKASVQTRNAVSAIGHANALFKTVSMDITLSEAEIIAYMEQQAQQYFNSPVEDLRMDFEILGKNANHADLMDIHWTMTRRLDVESKVAVLEESGLKVVAIDVDSLALQRAKKFSAQINKNILQDDEFLVCCGLAMWGR